MADPVLLAFETSTEACAVAVVSGGGCHARTEEIPRGHSRRLLALADAVLAEAGVPRSRLDGVGYGAGPGGFLGVRLAASAAQALALARDIPAVPVCTLQILAEGAAARHPLDVAEFAVALDARMDEVYWGRFRRVKSAPVRTVAVHPPVLAVPEGVPDPGVPHSGAGRGYRTHAARLPHPALGMDADALPQAGELALLVADAWSRGATVDAAAAEPLYLREAVQPPRGEKGQPGSDRHSS